MLRTFHRLRHINSISSRYYSGVDSSTQRWGFHNKRGAKSTGQLLTSRSQKNHSNTNLMKLLKGMVTSNACKVQNYSVDNLGHIVDQYFPYYPRNQESQILVEFFHERQSLRRNSPMRPEDKSNNPIAVVPASPGSGKSTFLAHFAKSDAYRVYCEDVDRVLISTLTFNSTMDTGKSAFGLRVLFGLLRATGSLIAHPEYMKWGEFYNAFKNFKSMTADQAIHMVDTYVTLNTSDRVRYLILVDELSKVQQLNEAKSGHEGEPLEAADIMAQLGRLLNNYDNLDIVVSSLSPQYVESLLTSSDRPIQYLVTGPLLEAGLGKKECYEWTQRLCNEANEYRKENYPDTKRSIDETFVKILNNIYILLSGHPRSIEALCKEISEPLTDWQLIISRLVARPKKFTYCQFLLELMNQISISVTRAVSLKNMMIDDMDAFIFSAEPVLPTDSTFRTLLENNTIMLHRKVSKCFIFMSQTAALLNWLHANKGQDFGLHKEKMNQVIKLFRDFEQLSISELWQYCIGVSILCHSYHRYDIKGVFGVNKLVTDTYTCAPKFKVKFHDEDSLTGNVLHIPKTRQAGFDLRLVLEEEDQSDSAQHIYVQCKIACPESDLKRVFAGVIYHSIHHFFQEAQGVSLEQISIVFYIWGDLRSSFLQEEGNRNEIIQALEEMKLKNDSIIIQHASSFVHSFWCKIHIVNKDDIKNWLLPSFLSIPSLIQAIDETQIN